MPETYIRTDELAEAVKGLEMVNKLLSDLPHDPYIWKWIIIALHMSLQGFMVLALKGSSGLNVLTDKSARAWLKAHEAGASTFPREKLDSFPGLYKKTKSDMMLKYGNSQKFTGTKEIDDSVRRLNSIRNGFLHFRPMLWVIQLEGLPLIAKHCLSVIRFLALDCGNFRYTKDYSQTSVRRLINQIDTAMDALAVQYKREAREIEFEGH